MIDLAYQLSSYPTIDLFWQNANLVTRYQYNLNGEIYLPLGNSTNNFVAIMTNMINRQTDLANTIIYIFIVAVVILASFQAVFMIVGSRLIYNQGRLFLNVPIRNCIELQKRAMLFYADVKVARGAILGRTRQWSWR